MNNICTTKHMHYNTRNFFRYYNLATVHAKSSHIQGRMTVFCFGGFKIPPQMFELCIGKKNFWKCSRGWGHTLLENLESEASQIG